MYRPLLQTRQRSTIVCRWMSKSRATHSSSFPATFVRGGTSNGLLINANALPEDQMLWKEILAGAMGSPDPYGRQLNGMGGGISSTSKICVLAKSAREDADVDYTFVQVGIKEGSLDMAGNCGNMSSMVGPYALDEGIIANPVTTPTEHGSHSATVRIFNTNTAKVIHSRFKISEQGKFDPKGDYSIDGVPGTGSRITLSFLNPGGAKTDRVLPTGNATDLLHLADSSSIQASLIDVANPGVFVQAADLGITGDIPPDEIGADETLMERLEMIRQAGAQAMGLDPSTQSIPKIVLVSTPSPEAAASGSHITCRALSMQQPHKAIPLTLALNVGVTCHIKGTLPSLVALQSDPGAVVINHASGKVEVGAAFEGQEIKSAVLHRTARVLMKGDVFWKLPD